MEDPAGGHLPGARTAGYHLNTNTIDRASPTPRARVNGRPTAVPFHARNLDWLKMKNPEAPAVKREAEEDWGRDGWRPR